MRRAILTSLSVERALLRLAESREIEASFVPMGERVAYYPVAERAVGRSGETTARPGVWLEPAEAAAYRACLLTASVLATCVGLFALMVMLVSALGRGDVAPYARALLGVGLVMAFGAQKVLPRALAAGRPPCPPRRELGGGAP